MVDTIRDRADSATNSNGDRLHSQPSGRSRSNEVGSRINHPADRRVAMALEMAAMGDLQELRQLNLPFGIPSCHRDQHGSYLVWSGGGIYR